MDRRAGLVEQVPTPSPTSARPTGSARTQLSLQQQANATSNGGTSHQPQPKARGANRSTKVGGKLKVLPDQPDTVDPATQTRTKADLEPVSKEQTTFRRPQPLVPLIEESSDFVSGSGASDGSAEYDDEDGINDLEDPEDAEVYNQISQIPEGTARRDALLLTKKTAKSLPRVTAYATASSYRLTDLMKFFQARKPAYRTNPRLLDGVIYTTYAYPNVTPNATTIPSSSVFEPTQNRDSNGKVADLLGIPEYDPSSQHGQGDQRALDSDVTVGSWTGNRNESEADTEGEAASTMTIKPKKKRKRERPFDEGAGELAEIFMFEYGTVVIWGMTEVQEKRFLTSIRKFEVEKLAHDDVEMEDLNFYYANYSRIYNDVITLRRGSGFMTKLSLSHALAQSVKISLFEDLISSTIEDTKDIPEIISETGKVGMPHKEIMQQIGELFLLRININLVGSVLDSPEVFWSYPDLQPLYEAARSYLEIPQRVDLLNTRVEVLQDMLQLLKESVSSRHSERLEQIVIALIGVEIVLGIITILVDVFG